MRPARAILAVDYLRTIYGEETGTYCTYSEDVEGMGMGTVTAGVTPWFLRSTSGPFYRELCPKYKSLERPLHTVTSVGISESHLLFRQGSEFKLHILSFLASIG
ncbi:hypothetical protein X801_05527, partial [Opisthorchis viverrini]